MFFERQGYHFFTFSDVDVAVSPWYLLLMGYIVLAPMLMGGGVMGGGIVAGISFAIAVTISLLVHEFGHAYVSKYYELRPSILLHGFGGLCSHHPADSDRDDALIVGAGPGAGILFGIVSLGLLFAVTAVVPPSGGKELTSSFLMNLVWVNFVWSAINLLLPLYPLDGGKLFHLLLRRFMPEADARDVTLKTSLFVGVATGALGLFVFQSFFFGILAFFLVMSNVQLLRSGQRLIERKARERASNFQEELLQEAEAALEQKDWAEAYRLCHQIRSTGGLPEKMMERVWEILAVTSVEQQLWSEAESYLKRAPETSLVARAQGRFEAHADEDG